MNIRSFTSSNPSFKGAGGSLIAKEPNPMAAAMAKLIMLKTYPIGPTRCPHMSMMSMITRFDL